MSIAGRIPSLLQFQFPETQQRGINGLFRCSLQAEFLRCCSSTFLKHNDGRSMGCFGVLCRPNSFVVAVPMLSKNTTTEDQWVVSVFFAGRTPSSLQFHFPETQRWGINGLFRCLLQAEFHRSCGSTFLKHNDGGSVGCLGVFCRPKSFVVAVPLS